MERIPRAQALQTTWGWPGNIFSVACKKTGARLRLARQGRAVVIRPVESSLVTGSSHSENRVMGSLISVRSRHQVKKTKAETTIKKKKNQKRIQLPSPAAPAVLAARRAPRLLSAEFHLHPAWVSPSLSVCVSLCSHSPPHSSEAHTWRITAEPLAAGLLSSSLWQTFLFIHSRSPSGVTSGTVMTIAPGG